MTDKHTNKHTNRHTDISNYRKNRPRGQILRKFKKIPSSPVLTSATTTTGQSPTWGGQTTWSTFQSNSPLGPKGNSAWIRILSEKHYLKLFDRYQFLNSGHITWSKASLIANLLFLPISPTYTLLLFQAPWLLERYSRPEIPPLNNYCSTGWNWRRKKKKETKQPMQCMIVTNAHIQPYKMLRILLLWIIIYQGEKIILFVK